MENKTNKGEKTMENKVKEIKVKCSNRKCSFFEHYTNEKDIKIALSFWGNHNCPFCGRFIVLAK